MRVAIVGANLLGCASAYRIRDALDANRADSSDQASLSDHITVFDKLPRAGGNKFVTHSIADTHVPIGTASGVDVSSAVVLRQLLEDAGIELPKRKPTRRWAIYDWGKDEYLLDKSPSSLLTSASQNTAICVMLQLFALITFIIFARDVHRQGVDAFIGVGRFQVRYIDYSKIVWLACSAVLVFGIVPTKWVFCAYNWLIFRFYVDATANMTYGGRSISSLGVIVKQLKENLTLIMQTGSATSCVTLGHFVSSCGLSTLVKSSASEYLGQYHVRQIFLDECISTAMAQTYGSTKCTPNHASSAFSTLLNVLVQSPMPTSLRSRALYLDAELTKALCPKIVDLARAQLKLQTEVTAVKRVSKGVYDVRGVDRDGKESSLGQFDAVILAAAVDPHSFHADSVQELESVLGLKYRQDEGVEGTVVNSAKYVSLVKGQLKSSFVKKCDVDDVATHVSILNCVNCSEIVRVGDDCYRIASNEAVREGSTVQETVFESVTEAVSFERTERRYGNGALRSLDGGDSPLFIVDTRFLNAACTDRLGNDVNIDCLSALNTGSFFRQGVADWK